MAATTTAGVIKFLGKLVIALSLLVPAYFHFSNPNEYGSTYTALESKINTVIQHISEGLTLPSWHPPSMVKKFGLLELFGGGLVLYGDILGPIILIIRAVGLLILGMWTPLNVILHSLQLLAHCAPLAVGLLLLA